MKLNSTDRIISNDHGSTLPPSRWLSRGKENGFEAEMFNSASVRLKTALRSKDTNIINQTVDILLDFSRDNDVKSIVNSISKHIRMCEYEKAETLLETL